MHKFFVDTDQIEDKKIYISGKDVKHIRDVLRLVENDRIEISSNGVSYICSIEKILKDSIVVDVLTSTVGKHEPPIEILLYQGIAKGSKMDLIIQKGTEVGVREFGVISTNRSIVKISDKKKEKTRIERLSSIAEEAAKQSKRDYIPKVKGIFSFEDILEILKDEDNIIVAYEDEDNLGMKEALGDIKGNRINLIIGPEGGFESYEIERLREIGAKIVSLGPRILRTETAGIVASTMILYEVGDLGAIL